MVNTIGELVPLAVAVAASPVQIVAAIAILTGDRPRRPALAFLAGWMPALLVVVLAVSAIPGLYGGSASPSTAAAWARLVLGALLVVVAVKSWRSRPGPGEVPEPPAWLERAETLGPARSFVLGAALVANPKILLLAAGAGMVIGQAQLSAAQQLGTAVVFVALGSSTVIAPVLAYLAGGDRATTLLASARRELVQHSAAITAAVLVILGAVLIGDAIEVLL